MNSRTRCIRAGALAALASLSTTASLGGESISRSFTVVVSPSDPVEAISRSFTVVFVVSDSVEAISRSFTVAVIGSNPPETLSRSFTVLRTIAGDVDGDGTVGFSDLNAVLTTFGQVGAGLDGDANGDGAVDFSDLNLVLSNFGNTSMR